VDPGFESFDSKNIGAKLFEYRGIPFLLAAVTAKKSPVASEILYADFSRSLPSTK
jgi:hypothetical protein